MTNETSPPHLQAVRHVYDNGRLTNTVRDGQPDILHLEYHPDASSGKDIILWEDILAAYKEDVVIHVRSGTRVLAFLKGPDFITYVTLIQLQTTFIMYYI